MKFKVQGQCFYANRTVHMPGAVIELDEKYAGHPALLLLDSVVEPDAPLMAGAESSDAVSTTSEPVEEVPADEAETTASEPEPSAFDDIISVVPKSKTKKG